MPQPPSSSTQTASAFQGRFLPLWGIIVLLVVAASYQYLFAVLHQPADYVAVGANEPNNAQLIEESRGKLLYCAAVSLLVFTLIWNLALSWSVIRREWISGVRPTNGYKVSFLALVGIVICLQLSVGTPLNLGGWYENLLLARLAAMESPRINGVIILADTATAVTILSILLMLGFLAAGDGEEGIAKLAYKINIYKISIYSAGLSLGAGVFEIYALYSWSALYSGEKETALALGFSATMTVATGLLFSALMIVMYLPVAFSLSKELWRYYPRGNGDAGSDKDQGLQVWAGQHGISTPPMSVFGSYVAILVPFATGILARILQIQS